MIRSPLRYPGGKSRAVERMAAILPPFDEFREPFLGGGSLFLHCRQKYQDKKFWGNDLYPELFLFWKHAQLNNEHVVSQVESWKRNYVKGKELYRFLNDNVAKFDELQRAAAFFVYNRITFSGTSLSGGYSERSFLERFTQSSIERLKAIAGVLENTRITNEDYEILVNTSGENVFLYLDPPYYSATKSALYGKNGNLHKDFDHIRFAENIKRCKHRWLITYDDSEYIRNLFGFANIVAWDLTYGMRNVTENSNQIGKELFISNYKIDGRMPGVCQQRLLFEVPY